MVDVVLTKNKIEPGETERLKQWMKADDIDRVFEAFSQSDHEIDREHEAVLVDGGSNAEYELLYHLTNPNRT